MPRRHEIRWYRIAAIASGAVVGPLFVLAMLGVAIGHQWEWDRDSQPDYCERGSYEGIEKEQLTAEELRTHNDVRFEGDVLRVLPPARICRVYGRPKSGPDRSARLLGEHADPELSYWVVLGLALLPVGVAEILFRRRRAPNRAQG
jgi:hypothetical protein